MGNKYKKLIRLCQDNNLVIINGLLYNSVFAFFRGNVKSQNDWFVTNYVDCIESFSIIPRLNVSDHCLLSIKVCMPKFIVSLNLINEVISGMFSYKSYDHSKLLKPKLKLENINSENVLEKFDNLQILF